MATDTGTANADATEWSFTLRDGLTFQDGSPITCADIAYGISRTFATDVINQGPTYQIQYLDIPTKDDGTSQYPGPYKATADQQALFDKAVTCDGNTITFHLNQSVADFNYTTTLGFNPVPNPKDHPGVDTGETYGDNPVSSGPYQIDSYTTGNGGKMVLVRNPNWDPASDPVRGAYPDKWEIDFGIDPKVMDQRLMASEGDDAYAVQYGNIQPENLATVFADEKTVNPDYVGRAFSDYDPYARYYFIDVNKVPNVKIRQAMAVALDRAAIRTNSGGAFAGDLGDGVIKPNLGDQYAPTGMWTDLFGQAIPDNGDPELRQAAHRRVRRGVPEPDLGLPADPDPRQGGGDRHRLAWQGRLQGHGQPDRARPVLQHRLRRQEGLRVRLGRLGSRLAERLDHHPAAVHQQGRLEPVARGPGQRRNQRSAVERQGLGRARPSSTTRPRRRCGRTSTRRPCRTSTSSRPRSV